MPKASSPKHMQRGEAGQSAACICEGRVRDTLIVLLLPLAISFHALP
jgi:hypothetical protein